MNGAPAVSAVTSKVLATEDAAAKPFPDAESATTSHNPTPAITTKPAEVTEQALFVVLAPRLNVTEFDEDEVALKVNAGSPKVLFPSAANVMFWLACPTTIR